MINGRLVLKYYLVKMKSQVKNYFIPKYTIIVYKINVNNMR